jgi:hypothetical protein
MQQPHVSSFSPAAKGWTWTHGDGGTNFNPSPAADWPIQNGNRGVIDQIGSDFTHIISFSIYFSRILVGAKIDRFRIRIRIYYTATGGGAILAS